MSVPTPPVEWLYFSKRGTVVHAIDPPPPRHNTQTLIALCGQVSEMSRAREPEEYSPKCFRCWNKVLESRPQEQIVVLPEDVARLEKSKMLRLDDYVYCLAHTDVHENTMDPYGEGEQACLKIWNGTGVGTKKVDVHRTLYWRGRIGDYPDA